MFRAMSLGRLPRAQAACQKENISSANYNFIKIRANYAKKVV